MDKKFEKHFEKAIKGFGMFAEAMMESQAKRNRQQAFIDAANHNLHTQKSGMALYDDGDKLFFAPDDPVAGRVTPFRGVGVAQVMSDGTFDFIRQPRLRAQSELIRKLPHGRLSRTKDGAIQLTLKVYQDEGLDIGQAIATEALAAAKALIGWQLKR